MKQPIFLSPVFKDYIWGGERLKTYLNKNTPYEKTAESWEISTNNNGKSKIVKGKEKGKTLFELFANKETREEIFGRKTISLEEFPLLVKFIDAENKLSVQVHPDDTYAKEVEHTMGKTEMWYVLDCKKEAKIICGMKENVKQEELKDIFYSEEVANYLNYLEIESGDCIYIPSGMVHAILEDTLICEVQQNSDITYRVYDWGRTDKNGNPRELHREKAVAVTNLEAKPKIVKTAKMEENYQTIVESPYFKTDKIKGDYKDSSDKETFYAMNVVKGKGILKAINQEYEIKLGDSFIIPSNLGEYEITGEIEILKSYLV